MDFKDLKAVQEGHRADPFPGIGAREVAVTTRVSRSNEPERGVRDHHFTRIRDGDSGGFDNVDCSPENPLFTGYVLGQKPAQNPEEAQIDEDAWSERSQLCRRVIDKFEHWGDYNNEGSEGHAEFTIKDGVLAVDVNFVYFVGNSNESSHSFRLDDFASVHEAGNQVLELGRPNEEPGVWSQF